MTFAGGIGHALPYLIPHFWTATTVATAVVAVELFAIAWIRNRYMDSPFSTTRLPGRRRRRAGVPGRHPHRQFVMGPADGRRPGLKARRNPSLTFRSGSISQERAATARGRSGKA